MSDSATFPTADGPRAALFAELFSPKMRYPGASLGYQLSAIVGGGLAPFIMVSLLEATGTSMSVPAYIVVLAITALLSISMLANRARAVASVPPHAGGPSSDRPPDAVGDPT